MLDPLLSVEWTARNTPRSRDYTRGGDSGLVGGLMLLGSARAASRVAQTYRCACCGHAVQHPDPSALRELARRHAAACGRAA